MTALQYSWYIGLHRIIDSERFLYGNRDCSQNTSSRRYYVEPRPHCHQYLCVMQYTQHCLSAQRSMATGKGVLLRGWYSEFFSRNLEARISVSYHSGPIRLSHVSVFIPATPFKDGSSYLTRWCSVQCSRVHCIQCKRRWLLQLRSKRSVVPFQNRLR